MRTRAAAPAPGPNAHWLNRTVLGTGLTSALGDCSYETSNAILPGFLAVLGVPAAALGAIEGVADAVSRFTKLGSGYLADRLGHRKTLVVAAYGLTAVLQVLLALAVGFHRAADTVGAVIGPLLGVALLAWAQRGPPGRGAPGDPSGPFRLVFWLALIPGVLSVLSFALFVRDDHRTPNPTLRFWTTVRGRPADFRRYLGAVGLFGLGDLAPTLLILAATQLLTPRRGVVRAAQAAALLYVGRNVMQMLAAFPVGRLADAVGHRRVLVVGYALGALTVALTALAFARHSGSVALLTLIFGLAGAYIAVEDALEASLTADYVTPEVRGIGYGVLGSVNGVGDFVSSTVVGAVWTAVSPVVAFAAAAMMAAGTLAMARLRSGVPHGRPGR